MTPSTFLSYVSIGFGVTIGVITLAVGIWLLLRWDTWGAALLRSLARHSSCRDACWPPPVLHHFHCSWPRRRTHKPPHSPCRRAANQRRQREELQATAAAQDARRAEAQAVQRMISEKRRATAAARKPYLVVHPGAEGQHAAACIAAGKAGTRRLPGRAGICMHCKLQLNRQHTTSLFELLPASLTCCSFCVTPTCCRWRC